mgnify:CR=1 FL=1
MSLGELSSPYESSDLIEVFLVGARTKLLILAPDFGVCPPVAILLYLYLLIRVDWIAGYFS